MQGRVDIECDLPLAMPECAFGNPDAAAGAASRVPNFYLRCKKFVHIGVRQGLRPNDTEISRPTACSPPARVSSEMGPTGRYCPAAKREALRMTISLLDSAPGMGEGPHPFGRTMTITDTPAALRQTLGGLPRPLVLVPTMGALHDGHLALIRRAREAAGPDGTVAVSIFVNPIQFDRADDLSHYPRPLEADLDACRVAGVDLVFHPPVAAMYAPDRSVIVNESLLSRGLCGATRPGHFDGVCTVVLKLFHLLVPDAAVFGEKDRQQLAVIRRMVRDLDVAVEIIGHPILREADGLALSSRNRRLTPEQRADAPRLHQALQAVVRRWEAGEAAAEVLLDGARALLAASPLVKIDYLELVDAGTLQPLHHVDRPAVVAAAVYYGEVRLIDNLQLG